MSLFSDRRPLRKIGGLRAYLRQVRWSLRWRLRQRLAGGGGETPGPAARNGRPVRPPPVGDRARPA